MLTLHASDDHVRFRLLQAAQCFHWFATQDSVDNIVRMLHPGCGLGLVWNMRAPQAPWSRAVEDLIHSAYPPGVPRQMGKQWLKALDHDRLTDVEEAEFPFVTHLTEEQLVAHVLSISVIAQSSEEIRRKTAEEVRQIFNSAPQQSIEGKSAVEMTWVAEAYWALKKE